MDSSFFNVFNFNAYRTSNLIKMEEFQRFIVSYNPSFVFIQEINVSNAIKVFSRSYQVFINLESNSKDGIGIVSLVKKGIYVSDCIIGKNGRILGLKIWNYQFWNVYPRSGTGFKNERELFFRETLCNLMMNWKDQSKYIFQLGDHNCIHRELDSLNNSKQHFQPSLVKHMQIHGLSDDFLNVHGDATVMFSRITNISKTRIDYILSNTKACSYFQYLQMTGLDHRAIFARYDIPLIFSKEKIPADKFFPGWVIPRRLEFDQTFLEDAKFIFKSIYEDSVASREGLDHSFYWLKTKTSIISLAKERDRQLFKDENRKLKILEGFYFSVINDIQNGLDCFQELENIKESLDLLYQKRSKNKIDEMRGIEIDDPTYDIHKLQNQRKFESQSKIKEIKIGNLTHRGTPDVVKAIEDKILLEVSPYNDVDFDAPPSFEEAYFLSKLEVLVLSDGDREQLLGPTNQEEISWILENEVDMDSSPGEDGLTYRFLKVFWKWQDFRFLYLNYLNFTRESKSSGLLENFGIMTVKNKKSHSIEYDKKRKLTKLNKDTNLGNGKVWTNRLKRLIIPKILPKSQFNCQTDINIIDEIREIRSVNNFLMGDDDFGQINGTILSIDFKDAFRSVSLRWFNLVMKHLKIPQEFIDWFWAMYRDLYIFIVINKYKSDRVFIKRGFMEGHPPSMAAFVISMIPMMTALEEKMIGIVTPDDKIHKIKLFADDLKCFIKDIDEIDKIYDVICKFEHVSGLKMHRDPSRGKCQALPFGSHRENTSWPCWVTVKTSMKVVGAFFSNNECIDKLNSDLVSKCFFMACSNSWGIKGTILQKVYFVNTFLLSKLWYTAQSFKINVKILNKILSKSLDFIFAGENEKPVRPLNFRDKQLGGLGLINPSVKSKAFLIKNMFKDFVELDCNIDDVWSIDSFYGYPKDFVRVFKNGLATAQVRQIYDFLLKDVIYKNETLIPSRNEKKSLNVKWGVAWQNFSSMKGLTASEKCFAWKVQQDMLPVGVRIHRINAERRCLAFVADNQCFEIQTLEHCFSTCERVVEIFESLKSILSNFLERDVGFNDIIHFSFNHRNKKKLFCALWLAVKILFKIFHDKSQNKSQILKLIMKEVDWNLDLNRKLGSRKVFNNLKEIMRNFI